MSVSSRYPQGLANSSGQLGRNFIPHFNSGVDGFLTGLIGRAVVNDEGYIDHAYLPSYMHAQKRDYARSFGVQIYTGIRRTTGWGAAGPRLRRHLQAARQGALPRVRQLSMLRRNDS